MGNSFSAFCLLFPIPAYTDTLHPSVIFLPHYTGILQPSAIFFPHYTDILQPSAIFLPHYTDILQRPDSYNFWYTPQYYNLYLLPDIPAYTLPSPASP